MTRRAANPGIHSMVPVALELDQIRLIERGALAEGLPLMQRAGAAAAGFVAQCMPAGARVLALAGPGNIGGDALVTARLCRAQGYDVEVVLPADPAKFPLEAAQAYAQWRAAGGAERKSLPDFAREGLPALVIDGLFGIGLRRPLGDEWQSIVDTVNGLGCPILALDIPSGLDAQTGEALGRPIHATWTIAFIAPARAITTPQGLAMAGECMCDRLGLTDAMIERYLGVSAG